MICFHLQIVCLELPQIFHKGWSLHLDCSPGLPLPGLFSSQTVIPHHIVKCRKWGISGVAFPRVRRRTLRSENMPCPKSWIWTVCSLQTIFSELSGKSNRVIFFFFFLKTSRKSSWTKLPLVVIWALVVKLYKRFTILFHHCCFFQLKSKRFHISYFGF